MRILRRFTRIGTILAVATALLGGAAVATTASPASAATCSGNGCDSQDPIAAGCSGDAYTVLSQSIYAGATYVGYNELRYSPSCGTNWGKTTSVVGTTDMSALVKRQSDSYFYEDTGNYSSAWSGMVYAPTAVACAYGTITYGGVVRQPAGWICA